jgi:hypothetical protein
MMVSDLEHFLDLPVDAPGPALRMADRLGRVVSAATAGDVGKPWTSAIRCQRRPGRRPCPGFIEVVRLEPDASIRWRCAACNDDGMISGWERSPYDPRQRDLRSAPAQHRVLVDPEMVTALQRITVLDVETARIVFRARSTGDGVVVTGSADALEDLAEHVAAESNHEAQRRRRRVLDATLEVLESELAAAR